MQSAGKAGRFLHALALLPAAAMMVAPAVAQQEDEANRSLPIVKVTAQKTMQDNQSVSASVFALTGASAQAQGLAGLTDLVGRVGNLHNLQTGSTPLISIRGMGQRLNTPGVGLYVDDVAYLDHFAFPANLQLADIERVEVVRGPQGTLYGGNTMGGVINIVTRQPHATLRGEASLTLGDYGLRRLGASVNVPISPDNLFLSLSAEHLQRAGYTENTFLKRDVDSLNEKGLRLRLRYLPTDRLDITLGVDAARIRDGYYDESASTGGRLEDNTPYQVAYDFEGADNKDLRGSSLRLQYDADTFTVTSITGLRDNEYTYRGDLDGSPAAVANDVYKVAQRQWTQELRIGSRSATAWSWLAGAFLFGDRRQIHDRFAYVPAGTETVTDGQRRSRGEALFGNVEYAFSPAWSLEGGLRLERETLSYSAGDTTFMAGAPVATTPANRFERTFSQPVPKASLMYKPEAGMLYYATVSKGYRSGGFNSRVLSEADRSYEAETSLNYEAGAKLASADRRWQLNAALFSIDVRGQQISQSIGSGVEVTRNGGKSRHRGAELDAAYLLDGGWQLSTSLGYLDAKFVSYVDAAAHVDYSGKRVPFAPDWVGSAALQKQHRLDNGLRLTGRVELRHVGKIYYDNANALEGRAYPLLNFRVGLEDTRWSAWLWAKNLNDAKYIKNTSVNPLTGGSHVSFGAPRTLGLDLLLRF